MPLFKTFEELNCWKEAVSLRRDLSRVVKAFPVEEKFLLVDQIKRASRSVTNNIAEGFGRFHYQEFIKFCRISRGSLFELTDHLLIAFDEKYISDAELSEFRVQIGKCTALLNGFINYLERQKDISEAKEPQVPYMTTYESTNQQINESTNS